MVKKMTQNDDSYNPRVKRHLDLLQDIPPRDPEAERLGKQNFLNFAASLPKPVSQKKSWRLNNWIPTINRMKERQTMFTITTLVVVLTMLFGGAGATVYAAQDSMPNDALYTVKIWTEDLQLGLIKDPEAKFELLEAYLLRRFAEMDELNKNGEAIPVALKTQLQKHLGLMAQLMAHHEDSDLDPYEEQLRTRDQDQTNQNENLPEWAEAQEREEINNRLQRIVNDCADLDGCQAPPELSPEPLKGDDNGGWGPGPGTNSGNPDEEDTFVPPAEAPGPACESEDCGTGTPQENVPEEPPMNGEENEKPEEPKQENNPDNGSGSKP
jgi:Domain of unknown function (DUF5667)